ncbi:squalene synthase HpnC [Undibacterium sp. SXout7W]|uniref:squalene synthase HpnC n=1 Tax=Undibacterium sp. SXout7W TaxID=3413049 RepID=UPI003BF20A6B
MSVEHYENFPVASILLPRHLRPAVEAIYAFARTADDIADEGDAQPEQRIAQLTEFEHELDQIEQRHRSASHLFQNLSSIIEQYQLDLQAFRDLLSAFKQDVGIKHYNNFHDLLDYCRRSANPVGNLMLCLYQSSTPQNVADSDAICSALQLANFWQDIGIDWKKERIYVPLEDLQRFGITEQQLADNANNQTIDAQWRHMMLFQTQRTRGMMLAGSGLAKRLPGRIGWELRLVIQGGLRILEKIEAVDGNVFRHRPVLEKSDWAIMLWRAICM